MILKNDKYQIQDIDLLDLIDQYGSPLYVYNTAKVLEKLQLMQEAYNGITIKIKYAVKALSNI